MITDSLVIEAINASLKIEHRVLDGRPIYQIVWAPDQLETRLGTFTDWYGSIMVRQEHKAVREVKKYWYKTTPCWVMEKLVFMPHERHMYDLIQELVKGRNGTYESVYFFEGGDPPRALPVVHEIVEAIIHRLHNPAEKMSQHDFDRMEAVEEEEEVKYFESEMSKDERSPLFVWDNSSFVSTNQLAFKKKLKLGEEYKVPINLVELS